METKFLLTIKSRKSIKKQDTANFASRSQVVTVTGDGNFSKHSGLVYCRKFNKRSNEAESAFSERASSTFFAFFDEGVKGGKRNSSTSSSTIFPLSSSSSSSSNGGGDAGMLSFPPSLNNDKTFSHSHSPTAAVGPAPLSKPTFSPASGVLANGGGGARFNNLWGVVVFSKSIDEDNIFWPPPPTLFCSSLEEFCGNGDEN
uniref:Uncharacterized protein n=1 Tax=Romanomermis culicivorax TaxID=13658 RepID=A0A915JPT9_ROMCU